MNQDINNDNDSMIKLQRLTNLMNSEERDYNEATKKLQLKKKEILREKSKLRSEQESRKKSAHDLKLLTDDAERLNLKLSAQILSVRELKNMHEQGREDESSHLKSSLASLIDSLDILDIWHKCECGYRTG